MQRETVYHTLEPWIDKSSRVLILGTMPSPKSRESNCYYGHPQNRFWPTLARVYEEPVPMTAEERKRFVLSRGLALWDVLASCDIRGAEDAAIASPVANDLLPLCRDYPICAIVTTGKKAKVLYDTLLAERLSLPVIALPSTSPANRRWCTDEQLEKAYRVLRTL